MLNGPMTPAEVEAEIGEVLEHLEVLTEEYRRQCEAAAEAEADYRLGYWRIYLTVKDQGLTGSDGTKRKATNDEADGIATTRNEDAFRAYKITAAAVESGRQALYTHRTRLDALRTVAANARTLAG